MGLKTVEKKVEDRRQKLHITEIELATQKQLVLELKAELQKAREEARMAREASRAAEVAAFERGILETEKRLAKEVARVCKEYCAEVWAESLNRVGVPVDSELRRAENIYISEDIWEVPEMLPPPVVGPLPPPE